MANIGAPGITVTMDLKGMPELKEMFRRAYEMGQDRKPLLKRVGLYVLATVTSHKASAMGNIKTAFEAHGRFTPWPALKPATVDRKEKQGKSPDDWLVDRGALRGSFSYDLIGDDGVEMGTAVPYALPLTTGWKHRGPSPMVEIGEGDEAEIVKYCHEWLESLGF